MIDSRLWIVASRLVRLHGHKARTVANAWQQEFHELGVDDVSSMWRTTETLVGDLLRTRPNAGEAVH